MGIRPASMLPLAAAALLQVLLHASAPASAHRPLLLGPVGGKVYHTAETALAVPWVTSSWSVKRVVECDAPFFWMKFTAEHANQDLHITAGVPALPGLAGLRVGLALFGPGLPPYNASRLGIPTPPVAPGQKQGMVRISSPADQTTCGFLENEVSKRFYKPSDFKAAGRRCAYYEPHGGSTLWITTDKNATLPVKGATYYLLSFLDGRKTTGRYTVAVANWGEDEDFKRPYQAPAGNRDAAAGGAAAGAGAAAEARCCGGGTGGAKGAAGAAASAAVVNVASCPLFSAFGCDAQKAPAASVPSPPVRTKAPEAARKLLDQGWTYVDVQTPEEFNEVHAPGSVNVPLMLPGAAGGRESKPDFLERMAKLFLPCSKIVVGCRIGVRSAAAAELLKGRFADIVSLDGGILAWKAAGLPVQSQ